MDTTASTFGCRRAATSTLGNSKKGRKELRVRSKDSSPSTLQHRCSTPHLPDMALPTSLRASLSLTSPRGGSSGSLRTGASLFRVSFIILARALPQNAVDPVPERPVDDRLVLAGICRALVRRFADIDPIVEQLIEIALVDQLALFAGNALCPERARQRGCRTSNPFLWLGGFVVWLPLARSEKLRRFRPETGPQSCRLRSAFLPRVE